jgi:hypothetical protein
MTGKRQERALVADLLPSAVRSPCRNICRVKRGLCMGCGRTLAEIERWPSASDPERRSIAAAAAGRLASPPRKIRRTP